MKLFITYFNLMRLRKSSKDYIIRICLLYLLNQRVAVIMQLNIVSKYLHIQFKIINKTFVHWLEIELHTNTIVINVAM